MPNQNLETGKPALKIIPLISNILLAAGAATGLFVLAKTYLFTGSLPAGACPVTLNRPWLYLSIGLLVLALVLSFFEPKKPKDVAK